MTSLNFEETIIHSILTDDLKNAASLLAKNPGKMPLLTELLKTVREKPLPLDHIKSKDPDFVVFFPSYTCGVGCKMCSTGFANKTQLYENYFHMTPEQFESCMPWIKKSSFVIFCGLGETLDSPHMIDFLRKIPDKISSIYTSGVPLTRNKIRELIQAGLKILTFSFDGKTELGHGAGNPVYTRKFWEKIDWVEQLKSEMNSPFPKVTLNIAISRDNQDELNELIDTAQQRGIKEISIDPMVSFDNQDFDKTIFSDFTNSKEKLNPVLDRWNSEGLDVKQTGFSNSFIDSNSCPYIDNWLNFVGADSSTLLAGVCEGPLEIPKPIQNFENKENWNSFPMRYLRYLHFYSSEQENKPMQCQNCILTNLKNFADLSLARNSGKGNEEDRALKHYRFASQLKVEKKWDAAHQGFLKSMENHHDFTLKGKAYFHLGEIELIRKNYPEAKKHFELAVQHYYNHALAFAYLYLLLMLDPLPSTARLMEKFDASGLVHSLYDKHLATIS